MARLDMDMRYLRVEGYFPDESGYGDPATALVGVAAVTDGETPNATVEIRMDDGNGGSAFVVLDNGQIEWLRDELYNALRAILNVPEADSE